MWRALFHVGIRRGVPRAEHKSGTLQRSGQSADETLIPYPRRIAPPAYRKPKVYSNYSFGGCYALSDSSDPRNLYELRSRFRASLRTLREKSFFRRLPGKSRQYSFHPMFSLLPPSTSECTSLTRHFVSELRIATMLGVVAGTRRGTSLSIRSALRRNSALAAFMYARTSAAVGWGA
jgi:hypothetical protein